MFYGCERGWGISISFPELIDFTEWIRIKTVLTFLKTTFSVEDEIVTFYLNKFEKCEETELKLGVPGEGGCGGGETPRSLLRDSTDLSTPNQTPWPARPLEPQPWSGPGI